MKILTLFFAYVALLNLAILRAWAYQLPTHPTKIKNTGRDRGGPGRGVAEFPNPHPDRAAWTNHGHNHPTEIQVNRPQRNIVITRVLNGGSSPNHFLIGDLVPNFSITSCNSPFGYAIVDLNDSESLYACLKPIAYHNESENSRQTGGVPEFIAIIIREGMVPRRLKGLLTTGDARITLTRTRGEFVRPNMHALGHVRYIKTDPIDPINADGDVYSCTHVEPRSRIDSE